jgi:adenylate cyclase
MSSSFEPPASPRPELPIEYTLLGGEPKYRKAEVAAAAGVDLPRAERLWQAMGFAHVGGDDVVFTDADVAALRLMVRLVAAAVIPPEIETAVARSLAQTMSRLAEWEVGIFKSVLGGQFAADVPGTVAFTEAILPVMEQLQGYVWRRHLAATAVRELDGFGSGPAERTLVIGFADIVGYTRLIRDFTEAELARLIDEFEDLATGVVAENRGRIVKTVGDEVLFVADTAEEGAEIGLALNEAVAGAAEVPPLRIGLAQGAVLARFGDVYGSTVNIASRLTSLARPASVLVDRELAGSLRGYPRYALQPIGPNRVQGFRGLHAWVLRRAH